MPLVALKERWNGLFEGETETGFGWSTTAEEVLGDLELDDRTILVTGCNSGLGKETMRVLAGSGATVFGSARSKKKARRACEDVRGDTHPVACDLANPDTILSLTQDLKSENVVLDAIVANAGIMALPEFEAVHGYEKQFLVNYVGHYLLVTELLDQLANDGRVVLLSSAAHRNAPEEGIDFENLTDDANYDPWRAYGQSKLAMLLFARNLTDRFEDGDTDRTAYAVHPGVIHTNLTRQMGAPVEYLMGIFSLLYLKSIPQGAATQTFAAVHPDAPRYSGCYLADCNPRKPSKIAQDDELAERLRTESHKIAGKLKS